MAASLSDLEQQARSLSADDRARLAEVLLESLQGTLADVEAAWNREIEDELRREAAGREAAGGRWKAAAWAALWLVWLALLLALLAQIKSLR